MYYKFYNEEERVFLPAEVACFRPRGVKLTWLFQTSISWDCLGQSTRRFQQNDRRGALYRYPEIILTNKLKTKFFFLTRNSL